MPRELERMMLGIPLRRPDASPVFCSALVEGLAKHILYMHQQIPCSYDELQRSVAPPPPEVDDEGEPVSRVRRPSMASRKAAKLVHALDELFAMLPGALALARVPQLSQLCSHLLYAHVNDEALAASCSASTISRAGAII